MKVSKNRDEKTSFESRLPHIPYCCSDHLNEALPMLNDDCFQVLWKVILLTLRKVFSLLR